MAKKRNRLFEFNLLAPKSEKLIEIEAERDESLIYSVILLLFGLLVFFVLSLANAFLISPRLDNAKAALAQRKEAVASYKEIKSENGELFIKTEALKEILKKDLDTDSIFDVADRIAATSPSVAIYNYSREQSGVFVFEFIGGDLAVTTDLLSAAKTIENVSNVEVREVIENGTGRVFIVMEMNITNA